MWRKTTKEEEEELTEKYNENCKEAAKAIANGDILLIITGAGFSADSGLPVFKDIANVAAYESQKLNYRDLSKPSLLETNSELFFGFWGSNFNAYRKTTPHSETKREEGLGPFFIFTSNVDSHSEKVGFNEQEVYEIHGTIEEWQCSLNCQSKFWSSPSHFQFEVDENTRLAPSSLSSSLSNLSNLSEQLNQMKNDINNGGVYSRDRIIRSNSNTKGKDFKSKVDEEDEEILNKIIQSFSNNHPSCIYCGISARPRILMFDDFTYQADYYRNAIHSYWKKTMQNYYVNYNKKVVIIELGCGINVPSCRCEGEALYTLYPQNCTLIRINPDFPLAGIGISDENIGNIGMFPIEEGAPRSFIPIQAKAKEALSSIFQYFSDSFNENK